MRSPILILSSFLFIVGCRKDPNFPDPEPIETCEEYEKTTDSYDFIVVTSDLSTSMYQKTLPSGEHENVEIDIDCDGLGDFSVIASASSSYLDGHSHTSANISFKCLNENLFVLTHLHKDSIYTSYELDTFGTTIYSNSYKYDYYFPGSTLHQVNTYRPIQGVSIGDTIFVDSPDWRNGQFKIDGRNTYHVSGEQDAGNGYYMYYESDEATNSGTFQNDEYIVIKYETDSLVKMGYIAVNASAGSGNYSFAYQFIRMHR